MAFGFTPKHNQELSISGISKMRALVVALDVAKKLNWNVGRVSASGIIAYTKFSMSSYSEEVRVRIEEESLQLNSECAGNQLFDWGKNKRNIESFISNFNALNSTYSDEYIESRVNELELDLIPDQDEFNDETALSQKGGISSFFSIFIPSKGYYITPILVNLNIAIFILMAISGVSALEPDTESLLLWGANFRPSTLDGEWWRLLTSCFIHIGIFHLLMNMYALVYIGLLLEPIVGKARFLSAFIITGIAGSIASLYWNELTVSAGASGAIFGMYGLFLAMLSTNLIEKSARKALLTSIGIFVGYNLLNGVNAGIDNAAHIGGLVSGLVIGFAFYPSIIKPNLPKLKYGIIGGLSVALVASALFILPTISGGDVAEYQAKIEEFVDLELKGVQINDVQATTDQDYLDELEVTTIPSWKAALELVHEMQALDLTPKLQERNDLLEQYVLQRIKWSELVYKSISENTDNYNDEIAQCNENIEFITSQLE